MLPLTAICTDEVIFRQVIDASPVGIAICDVSGSIALANPSILKMYGYEERELIGLSLGILIPKFNEFIAEGIDRTETASMPASDRSLVIRQLSASRKDGCVIQVEVDLRALHSARGTFLLAHIQDASLRNQGDGERSDRASLERLAMIGQMSGGIAHEIRTPLSAIRNDVYFLESQSSRLGPEANRAIQEINSSLGKAIRIVTELLDFARVPVSRPSAEKVSNILMAALKSYELPPTMALDIDRSIENLVVLANAEQIERIMINLLRNAVQAVLERGKIDIRGSESRENVMIDIIDSGPGIAEKDRPHIFSPLFTTKPQGIGLGLAISQRYAETNRGTLMALDNPAGGACFRLTLPRTQLSNEQGDHE